MTRLMAAAGIRPQSTQVRSGDAELTRITGAQAPSGVPVTITAPAPRRGAAPRARRRRPVASPASPREPRRLTRFRHRLHSFVHHGAPRRLTPLHHGLRF